MATTIKEVRGKERACSVSIKAEPIRIVVGSTKDICFVHESLIRKPNTFLDAALNKGWKEGQERSIELPEDDPEMFQLYIQWLYTGKIFCKTEQTHRNYRQIVQLYVLAEKLLDREFQDSVADAFVAATHDQDAPAPEQGTRYLPNASISELLYENTPEDSPMRRLLVDMHVRNLNVEWLSQHQSAPEHVNHVFLMDLAIALMKQCQLKEADRKKLLVLDTAPGCAYHHHGKDEPCKGVED